MLICFSGVSGLPKRFFPVFVFYSSIFVWLTATAVAANTKSLTGHVPALVKSQPAVGRLPAETRLDLAIGLPLRDRATLTNLIDQLYDPASTNYHRYLTTEQFTERFGPTEKEYQTVRDFALAHGLKVTTTHANRMLLGVSGRAADIEAAFNLRLQIYQHPTESRTFYAPDTEPSLDAELPVLDIMGLDNFIVPHPADFRRRVPHPMDDTNGIVAYNETGSGPGGLYMGTDFPHAYAPGVTNTGAGQYIGLMEFGPYWTNDIYVYQTNAHLPTNIVIQNVFLDGVTEPPAPGTDAGEQSLDIEMCMCMAPGATIIYYGGNNVNSILNRMATDNLAKQMSCSFGFGIDSTTEQIYQEFVAQGQDYFQASGDAGAYVGRIDPPAAEPYVTIVGGTALSTVTPNGAYQSETAWRGSGGGISTFYAIPNWQRGVSMAANGGSTSMRNFPDVSMMADTSIFIAANGGTGGVGGTSASSPLWAGFCALVNQQAATLGKPPVGFINPAIYAIGKGPSSTYLRCFHDITTGNTTNGTSGPTKFFATTGYDLATGWGSPTGSNLITALVGTGTTNFMLSVTPETIVTIPGGRATALVTVQPVNGFDGMVNLSLSGPTVGSTATFSPGTTPSTSILTLAGPASPASGYGLATLTATCGSLVQTMTMDIYVNPATSFTALPLPFNLAGVYNDGSTFGGNAGMDAGGNAYSAGLFPAALAWNGCAFNRGSAGVPDVVKCAGQTVMVPAGQFSAVNILAVAVAGAQSGQIFTMNYTDGSSTALVQGLSDWTYPQNLPGESMVATMAYRNTSGGTRDTVTEAYIYGYSFALDPAKTLRSVTLPNNGNIVVDGMAVANDFWISASPLAYNLTAGGSATASIAFGPTNIFNSARLSISGLPPGVTATFSPVTLSNFSTLTLTANANAPAFQGVVTITGAQGATAHNLTANLTVSTTLPGTAAANLSAAYNVTGIYTDGTTFSANAGLDGAGNAFSAKLLGTAPSWNGVVFGLGPANAPDAVQCLGQTISLPSGDFTSLMILATAVNGAQSTPGISVNFTDGTSSFYNLSVSDWTASQALAGGALAAGTAYANTSAGAPDRGMPVNLYACAFNLNDRRAVKSVTLPNNTNLIVFSLALANAASPIRLTGLYNRSGIYADGTSFATGGLDGGGYAYSANQLGSSLVWNSALFNFGPSNTLNSIKGTGQTITLASTNRYTTLRMLATGVQGNQTAQSFVITYTDGTSMTISQSLSDWANPRNYAGEAIAAAMTYRDSSGGGAQALNVNLYGYSFPLNNTKYVQSIRLPNNANVVVLALTLANSPVSAPLAAAFNRAGIYTEGTKFAANAGIDNDGSALSATLLGSLVTWNGMSFTFGAANATNVISCAGQTVALPQGQYTSMAVLATAVNGNQTGQSFLVNYTNGSASIFSQSLSDWANSQNYTGESNLVKMAYRVGSDGGRDTGTPVTLYGYEFNLNSNNVVQSVKLPNNPNVEVLAITLGNATLPVPEPPVISLQPVGLTVTNGGPATFLVNAIGSPILGYVWRLDGTNLANGGNLSGANSSTLNLAAVSTNDAGNFSVVITNAYGSVTSSVATLTIILPVAAPSFQSVTLLNGSVNFTWSATPGQTYQLQFSTDLSSGVWHPIGSPLTASGTTLTASDTVGPDPQRFYRVVGQ